MKRKVNLVNILLEIPEECETDEEVKELFLNNFPQGIRVIYLRWIYRRSDWNLEQGGKDETT